MNPAQSPATSGRRTLLLLASGALLLTFGWMLAGGVSQAATTAPAPAQGSDKAATVNGQVITMDEVSAKGKEKLDDLDSQYQKERTNRLKAALGELLEDRLLELEGKATGKTKEQLFAEGVVAKAGTVGDAEVDAYYEQLKTQQPGLPPKESIAGKIKEYLQQQKNQVARDAFFLVLRDKYKVEVFFEDPRAQVATEGQPSQGPANAPVTIVEFSDFECPYCGQVTPTLRKLKEHYGDKVRLVFRQFPLPASMHPHAQKAAEAAICALEQGKFWEMHDAMFGDQHALEVADLKKKSIAIGLDAAKFDTCLDSGQSVARIKDDQRAGALVGVSSTPAMFINGRSMLGAQPYEALAKVIDEELARPGKG